MNKYESLLDNLALAFGGHSQYTPHVVGLALAGQMNNNGWSESIEEAAEALANELAFIWNDTGSVRQDRENIRMSCERALSRLGVKV